MKTRFAVVDMRSMEAVAQIEMDDELLRPEHDLIDPETLCLKVKNGGIYTIRPLDDHRVKILTEIKWIFNRITTEPLPNFTAAINRMDGLMDAVRLMFTDITYIVISTKDDMTKLINPNVDHELKKVSYKVYNDIMELLGQLPEELSHNCGPNCDHH